MQADKILSIVGRAFIGAGVLVFLFVGYQLWGTDLSEARAQDSLKAQIKDFPTTSTVKGAPPATPITQVPNTTPAPPPAPQGDAVAILNIPKINLTKTIVEGTGVPDLKKGPGHYTNTPLPGQPGNAAIAGHRTTYGAPFGNLDQLNPGDEIDVTTKQGLFVYKVTNQKVVSPSDVSVLDGTSDSRLTLTTCHPKYSASKRLIITAELQGNAAPAAPAVPVTTPNTQPPVPGSPTTSTTEQDPSTITAAQLSGADLSGTSESKLPVIYWGALTILIAVLAYVGSRMWNRWGSYAIGTPCFLIVLYFFFENFSRLLPANA